jgi:hypothetical protein
LTATHYLEERGDPFNGYQEKGEEEEEEVTKQNLSMSSKQCPVVKRGIAFYRPFVDKPSDTMFMLLSKY